MSREQLQLRVDAAAIAELRELVAARGGAPGVVADAQLERLLARLPDVDLAATAVVMDPRPAWVAEFLPNGAGLPIRKALRRSR
jgi:hypothetical protein